MDDLIRRQDALDAMRGLTKWYVKKEGHINEGFSYDDVMFTLDKLPSAEPEIIRCKDCKHRYIEDMIWRCPFGLMGGENFFCGYGSLGTEEERRG